MQYYKERYNIDVREKQQPLLISMPKDKDKRRGDLQAVKIIPELTQMTGFTDQQRQNYKMMNVSTNQECRIVVKSCIVYSFRFQTIRTFF